jgi:hypothetical protein
MHLRSGKNIAVAAATDSSTEEPFEICRKRVKEMGKLREAKKRREEEVQQANALQQTQCLRDRFAENSMWALDPTSLTECHYNVGDWNFVGRCGKPDIEYLTSIFEPFGKCSISPCRTIFYFHNGTTAWLELHKDRPRYEVAADNFEDARNIVADFCSMLHPF